MELVSNNSPKEVAHARHMVEVAWTLQQLTANLMRVTRGAGKPYDIGRQAEEFLDALRAYQKDVGHFPSSYDIGATLSAKHPPEVLVRLSDEHMDEVEAELSIIKGALQIAASRMLRQRPQESAGYHQMNAGIRERRRLWDEQTRKREAEWKKTNSKRGTTKPTRPVVL